MGDRGVGRVVNVRKFQLGFYVPGGIRKFTVAIQRLAT